VGERVWRLLSGRHMNNLGGRECAQQAHRDPSFFIVGCWVAEWANLARRSLGKEMWNGMGWMMI
jgi:hypothetical protein